MDGARAGVGDRRPAEDPEALCCSQDGPRVGLTARSGHSETERRNYRKRKWFTALRNPPIPKPRNLLLSDAKTQGRAYRSPHRFPHPLC